MNISQVKVRLGLSENSSDEELDRALNQANQIIQACQASKSGLNLHAETSPLEVLNILARQESETVSGLRETIVTMGEEVRELRTEIQRADAMRDIQKFGAERPISEPMIETLVKVHMESPEAAIQLMSALPKLNQRFQWPDARQDVSDGGTASSPLDSEIKSNMA